MTKIAIIGAGYVGLCTAAGLAKLGHDVVCVDVDRKKVDMINSGRPPIYEDGLEEEMKRSGKRIAASVSYDSLGDSEIIFICVGTPAKKDGSMDAKYVLAAAGECGRHIKNYAVVVVKSTVVPGTTEKLIPLLEKSGKKAGRDFGLCMNPEFLREGFALEDFLKPDRIVIGEYDKKSGDALEKLYGKINAPLLRMNLRTAEMVKYASNAFRPAKISLINEIGNICKKLDIDVYDVANALGRDNVIGPRFLNAGIGFGGSCFTKDTAALISSARELGCDTKMLAGILDVNKKQRLLLVDMLKSRAGSLKGKKIALLGLAFKPGTDDVRDAPALEIIEKLKDAGCGISAYDPKAADNMKKIYPGVKYCSSAGEALRDADACLLLTEWPEFTRLTDRDFSVMRKKIIIEGRKVLDPKKVSGFEGVCW